MGWWFKSSTNMAQKMANNLHIDTLFSRLMLWIWVKNSERLQIYIVLNMVFLFLLENNVSV